MNIDDAHAMKMAEMLGALEDCEDPTQIGITLGLVGCVLSGRMVIAGVNEDGELMLSLTPKGEAEVENMGAAATAEGG